SGTAAGRSAASTTPHSSSACAPGRPRMPPTSRSVARAPGALGVEIAITTSGYRPAEVARHAAALHLAPAPRVAVGVHRAPHGGQQLAGFGLLEQEAR